MRELTLPEARTQAIEASKDGTVRHVIYNPFGEVQIADNATIEAYGDTLENDDILFVYREGKEY